MGHQARALDVTQEAYAQAGAFVGAFDQAGQIRDDKAAADARARAVHGNDAQVRFERGERIVGNLGASGGDAGNERGLAGVGQADEAHVCEQAQLEPQVALLAGLAIFRLARSLMPGLGEMLVAAAATAAFRGHEALALAGEVKEQLAGIFVVDEGADGYVEHGIAAGLAVAVGALAVAPGIGAKLAVEAVTQQGVLVDSGDELDAAALPAVAARWASARDELLPAEGHTAAAAVSGFHVDSGFVNKHVLLVDGNASGRSRRWGSDLSYTGD